MATKTEEIVGNRSFWYAVHLPAEYNKDGMESRREVIWPKDANLVGSREAGIPEEEEASHWPVLDIDFPVSLVPSSTIGHYHLYLEKRLTWKQYEKLLKALAEAGIIEEGYLKQALDRGQTFVRVPGNTKKAEQKKPKRERLNRY
jgi:hypothetical protein